MSAPKTIKVRRVGGGADVFTINESDFRGDVWVRADAQPAPPAVSELPVNPEPPALEPVEPERKRRKGAK